MSAVEARQDHWLATCPSLRRAGRAGAPALHILPDAAGRSLRQRGLADATLGSIGALFREVQPAKPYAAFLVPPTHPAHGPPGACGLRATQELGPGSAVFHYAGVLCTEAEAESSGERTASYVFNVDGENDFRPRLCVEGCPSFGGAHAPCAMGLVNGGQPADVNLTAITVLGMRCCAACPPFIHPHIFYVAHQTIEVGDELLVDYGEEFQEPADFVPTHVAVRCRASHAVLDTDTFMVTHEGQLMSPIQFEEASGGAAAKNWRCSIKVRGAPPMHPVAAWPAARTRRLTTPRGHAAWGVQGGA
jgi:hypothetical protein